MAANAETCLLAGENYSGVLAGQDWYVYREALAYGVQWMCKIWEVDAFYVDLLERLRYEGF
jgi:hypothetical protein